MPERVMKEEAEEEILTSTVVLLTKTAAVKEEEEESKEGEENQELLEELLGVPDDEEGEDEIELLLQGVEDLNDDLGLAIVASLKMEANGVLIAEGLPNIPIIAIRPKPAITDKEFYKAM